MKHIMTILVFYFFLAVVILNPTDQGYSQKDSIFQIIKSTNGHIFSQMRGMKNNFHPEIQDAFEKSIKEYEYRYLSNPRDFVDFIWDKFEHLKNFEQNKKINLNEIYQQDIYDFLKEFLSFYNSLDKIEKEHVDNLIEKQDGFTKDLLKSAREHSFILDDNIFGHVSNLVESLPIFFFKSGNITDHKTIPSKKINDDFKNFIEMLYKEYDLHEIRNQKSYSDKNKKAEEIIKSFKPKHKEWFSSFMEEYIQEAVVNNDDFKKYYTLNKMRDIDLSILKENYDSEQNKISHLMKKPPNGPFRFKYTVENLIKVEKPKINAKTVGKALNKNPGAAAKAKKVIDKIIGANRKEAAEEEAIEKTDLSGPCDEREAKLKNQLQKKLDNLEKKEKESENELKEVPKDILGVAGNPKASAMMAMNLIAKFIKKLIVLLVKHIPFFFFKFCIPPGPLTFGCCPEAGFFPQQMYNVFTALEKVDKFKTVAKGYPDWLSGIGGEQFGEIRYYMCAQSFLTVHESALFNICNFQTMNYYNPLNLMGMIPGDYPLCFYACLQTLAVCGTPLENIGPCDSIINPEMIIKAMFDVPARLRLSYAFTGMCTYIPFLIRWDLVPKWKKPDSSSGGGGNGSEGGTGNGGDSDNGADDSNCADKNDGKQEQPLSAFEKGFLELDPNGMNFINSLRNQPQSKPEPHYEKRERGAPVKRSKDIKVKVDIDADFRMGKRIANADTNADIISTLDDQEVYSNKMIYHILNYHQDASKQKEKDFPFHTKRILVND